MLHHLSLPTRHTPYASSSPEDVVVSRGQTVHSIPRGFKRTRIFSHVRPYSPDVLETFPASPARDKENLRFQGAPSLSPICSEDEGPEGFDPADSSTWGVERPLFLHNGAMLPVSRRDVPPRTVRDDGDDKDDDEEDIGSLLLSPATSSPRIMTPVCDQFLKMMDEKLQLNATNRPEEDPSHGAVRTASSSYPSQGASTRVQSPDSFLRPNKLSLSDLSRFGQANDRLSNLRSSSELEASLAAESHEVLVEANTAIAQWQDEVRPRIVSYKQYELTDSSEVLPCDSMSQRQSPETAPSRAVRPHRARDAAGLTWDSIQAIKGQYDGVHESHHRLSSPDPAMAVPPYALPAYTQPHSPKQSKRKASVFSLRSLTNSFAKRPRLGFRRWASNVWQQSSHRLSQARHKWRQQAAGDGRAFEAWRARHRRANQADSPRSKPSEKGYGAFAPERKTCGNDEWWRDGVSRYEAPKWMLFTR